ncbi:prolyl-tRNA synthetase, partial [Candidatus Gracilibacteria bacterium]|nr:prolyl-tRNA synthetase [Candidatus Gracilibacteria bacterium]
YSYEFQTEIGIGEDEIFICRKCNQAHNKEIIDENNFVCAECGHTECDKKIVSEVANIFKLGSRFSDAFGLKYQDADGQTKNIVMGCYGIGVSRLMGLIAEKFNDEKGLIWPENIAPFSHHLIVLGDNLAKAQELAKKLESDGSTVLLDDRNSGFGQKATDADLFGIPNRVIVSDKTLEKGGYELKKRTESDGTIIAL